MSLYVLGKTIPFHFTNHDPTTGNISDADSLPTAKVFEDAGTTSMYSATVAKCGSETGVYMVSIEATSINGFEIEKSYNVIVEATVNSVTAKARIAQFNLENITLQDLAEVKYRVTRPVRGSKEELWERIK